MTLLATWHLHQRRPASDLPIVSVAGIDCEPRRLANVLQADLHAAGVTREILFETDASNVEPLRFHDLRSTFCTWARRLGKSDAWISERTGHDLAGDMINRYDRGATTLEDLSYAPFPDIGRAIPELAARLAVVAWLRGCLALATRLATPPEAPQETAPVSPTIPEVYQSGREDSNLRHLDPQSSALTRLRYAPNTPYAEATEALAT